MSGQLVLGGIEHKDREKIIQIKLMLIMGVRVVETKGTRLGVGHSCWEQMKLVEIDKVIKGCKLEIEGHVFDIDLIPFGHGSFDVIISMDWLSKYKTKIIYCEKVVRIPLPDGKVLRVLGERSKEKARFLMGVKKQEEIVVIELIPGATPVAKSPYSLALFELEELSGQLKEL
ncbi:putative reverse transcriptase domain-containing protein [Tanacetum coccineum]